jgi:CTP synthase (UTP-ammonia lyase)
MIAPSLAVVGDHNPSLPTHVALDRAAERLPHIAAVEWVSTEELTEPAPRLAGFDGIWVAPGSPYRSDEGALAAIRHARQNGTPLYGT